MQRSPWRGGQDGSHNCKIKPQNKKMAMFSQNTLHKINCPLISKLDKSGAVESKLHWSNCHLTLNLANFGRAMAQRGTVGAEKARCPLRLSYEAATGHNCNPLAGCPVACLPFGKAAADTEPSCCTPGPRQRKGKGFCPALNGCS